ncbi:short-chain dehydrogenase [Actinophytocola xinjiangensis]|uniref:Short-chain dehydrogenase n=1 Tax=Actinophytocola xinjiangensis TaxID=485602 RepID=A0A7Z0WDA3_9PSEU|nr:SDR family NAD(P)-dependent oxidoreductase [Actinophytocola xinjiangensis]OLF04731.1 short-chain dehydrogenase [Actinophytocola xinjiangensis]
MVTTPLVVAITGANSGIGLRAAERLAVDGHRVYAICRTPERGQAALARINSRARTPARLVLADLAEPASIDSAVNHLQGEVDHLDVLINNAAVFDQTIRTPQVTAAGHELFWSTNHLGPFRLTAGLSHLLVNAPRPRLISVASKGLLTMPRIKIRFDELDDLSWYSPTRAYYHAKLAQIMVSHQLALRTVGELDVACVRVPAVRLDADRIAALPPLLRLMYVPKNRMAAPPERLADTYRSLATRQTTWTAHATSTGGARGELRGIYLDEHERPVTAPAFAYDAQARQRLWDLSQHATGSPTWAW